MKNACAPFEGKKITLLGLGLLGRGVGDAEFLAECGAHLTVTDVKTKEALTESVERLKKFPNIEFHLGEHKKDDFENVDLVIKAAGVPLDSREIEIAKENNVPVAMSTALFAKYASENGPVKGGSPHGAGAIVVGVTGTRGKSTVAHMIFHVLQQTKLRSHLGGNIRGISTLAMLPEVEPRDICVLELDSWQLQGFGDLRISPHISVFTNLMPDHLNYYPSMEEYFWDKANIFRFQKPGDTLIVGKNIFEKISAARPPVAPRLPEPLPHHWELKILGEHNRENAAFAAAALRSLQLSEDEIKHGIESFEGVEGRLQFVREVNGIKIYNDNNSTTPEATVAALEALQREANSEKRTEITLIVGGSEKQLDLDELVSSIKRNVSHVILLMHEHYKGSVRLSNELHKANIQFNDANSLQKAVELAMLEAKPPITILFSPAFASFGMFKNEYDRGDQFLKIVRGL